MTVDKIPHNALHAGKKKQRQTKTMMYRQCK